MPVADKVKAVVDRLDAVGGRLTLMERRDAMRRVLERGDAQWNESDHPRAPDGKFGSGGGADPRGSLKEDLGGDEHPELGKPFLVYRAGKHHERSLAGRNAGSAHTVAAFMAHHDDAVGATYGSAPEAIHAYEVSLTHPPGEYQNMKGEIDPSAKQAGRTGKYMDRYKGASYSFHGEGQGYTSRYLGSASLEDVRTRLPYGSFDEAGANAGEGIIQASMFHAPADRADADWRESDHPRETDGRFGKGGAGGENQQGGGEAWAERGKRPPFAKEEVQHLPASSTHRGIKTWEDLQSKGSEGQKLFAEGLGNVAKSLGLKTDVTSPTEFTEEHLSNEHGYLIVAPPKGEARSREKIEEYGGNARHLKDYLRASIAVSKMDDVRDAIQKIEAEGFKIAQKPKDNFSHPHQGGYRDLNLVFRLPKTGMVAEVQFHLKPMIAAKNEGHKHYETQRALQSKYRTVEPTESWEAEHREAFGKSLKEQERIYGAGWDRSLRAQPKD